MGRGFRARSPGSVLNEISWLKDKYKIRSLIFDDDNILNDRFRAFGIFEGMLEGGLAMPWKLIATAAFKLDRKLLKLMRRSGCQYINVAVESGVERVLKDIIHKPINLEQVKDVTRIAREEGIYVAANFIIGFPGESWGEIRRTITYAEGFGADYVKIFGAMPLHNTELWRLCEKHGAFKEGFSEKDYWSSGQIETKEFSPGDISILRAYEWERLNFDTQAKIKKTAQMMDITIEELNAIRKRTLLNARLSVSSSNDSETHPSSHPHPQ